MKKYYLIILLLIVTACIFTGPGYAIIGTQLLQNTGFEDPITWDVITSRSLQMNRWGLHPWSLTPNDTQQLFYADTAHQGTGYIRLVRNPGDASGNRYAIQWVDVSAYAGQGYRVFGSGWAMRGPNCISAATATGNFWVHWSTLTTDYLDPSQTPQLAGVSSNVVALNVWQPIVAMDFDLPADYINLGPAVILAYYSGNGPFEHYWDDVQFWVNDQVTEYKSVNFDTAVPNIVVDTSLGAVNETACYYPRVIKDDGVYKMWYAAACNTTFGTTTSYFNAFGYATSSDGINWTKLGPVLIQDMTLAYESSSWFYPGPVLKELIGGVTTYRMWYNPIGVGPDQTGTRYRLGLATSPDGINWTRYPGNPVLGCNTTGFAAYSVMDYNGVEFPSVTKMGSTYKLWFSGISLQRIGYTDSTDGINWSQPVFNLFTGWTTQNIDKTNIGMPSVVYDAEAGIYHMWYSAIPSLGIGGNNTNGYTICHAVSDDGIFWTKDPRNPVILRGLPDSVNNWSYGSSVLRDGNKYKMWYTVYGVNANVTTIRVAYTEGTVESSPTLISPDSIVRPQGSIVILTQSGGIAPVSWLSTDSTIASIESTANNGRTAYVKANALGSVTITATDFYENSANASVTVVETGAPVFQENKSSLLQRRKFIAELFE